MPRTPLRHRRNIAMKLKYTVTALAALSIAACQTTTPDEPTFVEHGVVHHCLPNLPSSVARTTTSAGSAVVSSETQVPLRRKRR